MLFRTWARPVYIAARPQMIPSYPARMVIAGLPSRSPAASRKKSMVTVAKTN